MQIKRIKGVVKNYAWGNTDYIPSLLGGYDGNPQAEYWMGTHPSGEAVLEDGTRLSEYLKSDDGILGLGNIEKFGKTLPLLFKVLAIATPLSLQCHPDKKQAKEGWAREEELRKQGLPYNYQDDNQKAEILVALSPVTAMCGFRPNDEIRANLGRMLPVSYSKYLESYSSDNKSLFLRLYDLDKPEVEEILAEFKESLDNAECRSWNGNFLTPKGVAKRCLEIYPGDIGALFPIILNVIHLQIGEGLYLNPDTLHAYVNGNGIELMDASDNVLRGGLTPKRIDLAELQRVMKFESESVSKAPMNKDSYGRRVYKTPTDAFTLLSAVSGDYHITESRVMLALVTEGMVRFSSEGDSLTLEKGECALIPKSMAEYSMKVRGQIFFAAVPEER